MKDKKSETLNSALLLALEEVKTRVRRCKLSVSVVRASANFASRFPHALRVIRMSSVYRAAGILWTANAYMIDSHSLGEESLTVFHITKLTTFCPIYSNIKRNLERRLSTFKDIGDTGVLILSVEYTSNIFDKFLWQL